MNMHICFYFYKKQQLCPGPAILLQVQVLDHHLTMIIQATLFLDQFILTIQLQATLVLDHLRVTIQATLVLDHLNVTIQATLFLALLIPHPQVDLYSMLSYACVT